MVVCNACHPFLALLVVEDPGYARCVGGVEPPIPGVLRPIAAPQVLFAIVGPVFVDVVNKLSGLGVHHYPVEPHKPLLVVEVVATYQIPIFVSIPNMALDCR